MKQPERLGLALLAASVALSGGAAVLGYRGLAVVVLAPATALSGLATIGHLVTLDDEMPGGWANPEGSPEAWRNSMVRLIMKGAVFTGLIAACISLAE